jgi:hypothetical protein
MTEQVQTSILWSGAMTTCIYTNNL